MAEGLHEGEVGWGWALPPFPYRRDGQERAVGVEIELAGVEPDTVAGLVAETLGGAVCAPDETGKRAIKGGALGEIEVFLDTRYRGALERWAPEPLKQLAETVIPVEIVTGPIPMSRLGELDPLVERLRAAGALGSRAGLRLALGVHFNPEVRSKTLEDIFPAMLAYGLAEPGLRELDTLDLSRRITPFIEPWPEPLVRDLMAHPPEDLRSLVELYLHHAPSRNYGLDMLCLFAELFPERVREAVGDEAVSPRPTFHVRFPECRVDEPEWTLAQAWAPWVAVERAASDAAVTRALKAEWQREGGPRAEALAGIMAPLLGP